MSYNHHYKILILSCFVFLAGCTQSTGSNENNGLIISSLSPDLDGISGNTTIPISMLVENTGEYKTLSTGNAELVGLDTWTIDKREQDVNSLEAADPAHNLKGGQQLIQWTAISPENQFDQKYDFSVKLSYFYKSESTILLNVVGLDYFKTLSKDEQAKVNQGIKSVSTTKGPIQISAKTQSAFLSQSKELPLEIYIQNVGTGRAYFSPIDKENLDKVLVQVSVDGRELKCGTGEVKLANGKTGRLICKLDTTGITSLKTFSIDSVISYAYLIEEASSVTVLKSQ